MTASFRNPIGRTFLLASLAFALCDAPPLRAQPPSVEAVVAKVESGVACVLVSRSEWYRKLDLIDGTEAPGKLGAFDAHRIDDWRIGAVPGELEFQIEERRRAFIRKLDLASPRYVPESFGSGIVIDAKGLILTNYHVVQDAVKVYVRLPGGKGSYADIWAADPRSDLAVLKVQNDRMLPLTPIPLGNGDEVRRGQQVIALANPYAAGQNDGLPSVSAGVISNLRRRVPGRQPVNETNANPLYQYGILLQTDARIALGSSGGALVNLQGECIGITTSLAALAGSDAPGGFAVPVNSTLRKIIEVLRKGEEVEYGYLGVMMGEAPAPQGGAEIFGSQFGAPAQTDALLQKGDVIVAIGDRPVHDNQDLMLGLGLCLAGEKTTLGVVRRGGRQQKVEVTLAKYNVHENLGKRIWSSPGNRPYVGGLRVDYTSILAQKPHSRADVPSGVVVADVQKGSKAERCVVLTDDTKANNLERTQLGAEDIITQVAGVPVANPRAFYEQVARHNGPIELTLRRGNQTLRVRW